MAVPIVPAVDFVVRLKSMDVWMIHEVLYQNVYHLPPLMKGAEVYDIGANIGAFAAACVARGAKKVTCVEPHPDNFRVLQLNLGGNRKFKLVNRAVWSIGADEVKFTSHGSYTAAWRCMTDGEDCAESVQVKCCTLDEVIPSRAFDWLKLDCEGGEWPGVYQSQRIVHARNVLIETHESCAVPGFNCTVDGMIAHLEGLGFRVHQYTDGAQPGKGQVYLHAVNQRF